MTWLSGWGKRIKLTLDSFRVDEDLTDFPVLVTLASGTGKNSADVTNIFDELYIIGNIPTKWNSDDKAAGITLSNSDLTATWVGGSGWDAVRSIASRSSGKWYWEVKVDVTSTNFFIGIGTSAETLTYPGDTTAGYGYASSNGYKFHSSGSAYGSTFTTNDVISVALDLDNGKIWWAKNGVWQASGDPAAGTNPAYTGVSGDFYAMVGLYTNNAVTANFGGSSFIYTVPTGFNSGFGLTGNVSDGMKMMLTNSDGATPCYVEIERWDAANEQAWLWVKVPAVVSGTDTELYLYYDKTQNDNDHYIGDTGEEAAKNVWDDDFVGVWHMAQDPSGGAGCIKDSTRIANPGTTGGSMTPADLVGGKVGKALDFDGTDDFVNFGSATNLDDIIIKTLEITTYLHARSPSQNNIGSHIINKGDTAWFLTTDHANTRNVFGHNFDTNSGRWAFPEFTLNAWHCVAVTYDRSSVGNDPIVYVDASVQTIDAYATPSGIALSDAANDLLISKSPNYDRCVDGVLDEVRVSNIDRSAAWIKATYYSNWNNFVTFGAEEEEPVYYLDGFVKERNQPVSRVVKLYRRDTGAFVDSDTSRSSDGYYYLTTPSSGTHFIVAFDDDTGDEFNALILDKVSIKGTV